MPLFYDHDEDPAVVYYDIYSRRQNIDIPFFQAAAQRADGPVLELACGTGRLLLPLARAGVTITGLDISRPMLNRLEAALSDEPLEVQQRVTVIEGDMSDFDLDQTYDLIYVPFNSFLLLTEPGQQRRALDTIHRHLSDDGRLIISIFDPKISIIAAYLGTEAGKVTKRQTFTAPDSGNQVVLYDVRTYDLVNQINDVDFVFEEYDDKGRMISRVMQHIVIRWLYRYEAEYLFELTGFEVESLHGDYDGGDFAHGGLQVWTLKKG